VFINDKIAYLQLQKTACTHVASVMHSLSPGAFRIKHSPLREDVGDRLVVGSVRNPWDWYVSLWAYGCLRRGVMYAQLTCPFPKLAYRMFRASALHPNLWAQTAQKVAYNAHKDHREWIDYYADVNDPNLFRAWLKAMMSDDGKRYLMEDYPVLPLRVFAGLLTFRFLQLHVDHTHWRRCAAEIRSRDDLRALYQRHVIIDRFIRMENLGDDFSTILNDLGIPHHLEEIKNRSKTNVSEHRHASYYYDEETIELVRSHDLLIVEEFGYVAPAIQTTAALD